MFVDNVFTEFIEFLDNKIAYATTALSGGFYSIHLCLVFLQIGDLSPLQFAFFSCTRGVIKVKVDGVALFQVHNNLEGR